MNYSKLSLFVGRMFGFLAIADLILWCTIGAYIEAWEHSTSPAYKLLTLFFHFKTVVILLLLSIVFLFDGFIRSKNL